MIRETQGVIPLYYRQYTIPHRLQSCLPLPRSSSQRPRAAGSPAFLRQEQLLMLIAGTIACVSTTQPTYPCFPPSFIKNIINSLDFKFNQAPGAGPRQARTPGAGLSPPQWKIRSTGALRSWSAQPWVKFHRSKFREIPEILRRSRPKNLGFFNHVPGEAWGRL